MSETFTPLLSVSLGVQGFRAWAPYSGKDYEKFVDCSGSLVIGGLPDDDLPDLKQYGAHTVNGVTWTPSSLVEFASTRFDGTPR